MSTIRLPAAQHLAQPWKNGLGVSQIIAGDPPGAGYDALLWQVGGTEITADCPFSSLPELDRLFIVIEGNGVELTSTDEGGKTRKARVETMQAPYAFRGDWKTDCRLLDGPVRVLNVVARRGRCSAEMALFQAQQLKSMKKKGNEILLVIELATLDAWILDGQGPPPRPLTERAALIRITPHAPMNPPELAVF